MVCHLFMGRAQKVYLLIISYLVDKLLKCGFNKCNILWQLFFQKEFIDGGGTGSDNFFNVVFMKELQYRCNSVFFVKRPQHLRFGFREV
ncbi:MAG: hypothetical protein FWG84_06645 [Bacteroidales bacterium]|nr:hypothetical protein [Bacteroidales bacterium]